MTPVPQAAVDAAMKVDGCAPYWNTFREPPRCECILHGELWAEGRGCSFILTIAAAVVAAVQGPIKAEALREAAAGIAPDHHHCFRPQGCVDCGRQKARAAFRIWLRDRADRLEAQP